MIRILAVFLLFTAVAARAVPEPVYEPKFVAINAGGQLSEEQVKQAFLRAATRIKGWTLSELRPGMLEGDLDVRKRKQQLSVNILYSGKDYSIIYVGSENMDYNAEAKTIHPNYGRYIRNLEKFFLENLNAIWMKSPTAPATAPAAPPDSSKD